MFIYKVTNKLNGKFYIGLTTRNIKRRLKEHMYNGDTGLYAPIKKYGIENFVIETIDTAKSFNDLEKKEMKHIKKLKPHYNLSNVIKTCFVHSDETKKKISKSLKKDGLMKWSDERKEHYSNMFSGKGNPMYGKTPWLGKKHKKESLEKMTNSKLGNKNPMFGRKHSEETIRKIKETWKKKRAKVA